MEASDDKQSDILIDGDRLRILDSTGLGTLISILKKAKESIIIG